MSMFESELRDAEQARAISNHGRLASFAKASAGPGKPPLLGVTRGRRNVYGDL